MGWPVPANWVILSAMVDLLRLLWCLVTGLFRSRAALQAEILVLRHQVNVLRRKSPKRLVFSNIDRLVFAGFYALMQTANQARCNTADSSIFPVSDPVRPIFSLIRSPKFPVRI